MKIQTDSGKIHLTGLQSTLAAGRARLDELDEQRANLGDVAARGSDANTRLVIARERLKKLRQEEERADALRALVREAEHDRDKAADALARAELVPGQVGRVLEDALVHREQLEAREKALGEAGVEHAAERAAVDDAIEAAHRERVAAYQAVDDARAELRARERDVTEVMYAAGPADHRVQLVAERKAAEEDLRAAEHAAATVEQQIDLAHALETRAAALRASLKRAEQGVSDWWRLAGGPEEDGARALVITYLREVRKAIDVSRGPKGDPLVG